MIFKGHLDIRDPQIFIEISFGEIIIILFITRILESGEINLSKKSV